MYDTKFCMWKKHSHDIDHTSSVTIVVLMTLRDNAIYCEYVLPQIMSSLKIALVGYAIKYYFYENNSTDKTPGLLASLASIHNNVHVLSEILNEPSSESSSPEGARSSTRCARIAKCRNTLVGFALDDIVQAHAVILLDTNIFISGSTVLKLINEIKRQPAFGMVCGYTVDANNTSHYYDTYALTNVSDKDKYHSVRRHTCPFKSCTRCNPIKRTKFYGRERTNMYEVMSAFGGVAILTPSALLSGYWFSDNNQCEHIYFCTKLRDAGYKIGILRSARAQWVSNITELYKYPSLAEQVFSVIT